MLSGTDIYTYIVNLQLIDIQSNRAGSGYQRPELLQVAVAAPTGENPGSH